MLKIKIPTTKAQLKKQQTEKAWWHYYCFVKWVNFHYMLLVMSSYDMLNIFIIWGMFFLWKYIRRMYVQKMINITITKHKHNIRPHKTKHTFVSGQKNTHQTCSQKVSCRKLLIIYLITTKTAAKSNTWFLIYLFITATDTVNPIITREIDLTAK